LTDFCYATYAACCWWFGLFLCNRRIKNEILELLLFNFLFCVSIEKVINQKINDDIYCASSLTPFNALDAISIFPRTKSVKVHCYQFDDLRKKDFAENVN
jgi:hypothetical protein